MPQQDQGFYDASTTDIYGLYELIRHFVVSTLSIFVYCSGLFTNETEAQMRDTGLITEVELSVLLFYAFLRAVCAGPAKQFPVSRLFKKCDGQEVLIVLHVMIKERLHYRILRLIDGTTVNRTMALVSLALLCEIDWDTLGSNK